MSEVEVVEAEVEEVGAEVVPVSEAVPNLFHTTDPGEVLKRAMTTANALMPVVRDKGLIVAIQGKDHLTVEAWQTLGAMLGVTPVCTWTRKLENGWEARVEARTLDGRVIGAAEAECLTAESHWADADDYAVRSMAQTRATSKSLASVLRFVATLGGAAGTPAEEMPANGGANRPGFASEKQEQFMRSLLKKVGTKDAAIDRICAYCTATMEGGRDKGISKMIDGLKEEGRPIAEQLALDSLAWAEKQTDTPGDTTGLPEVEDA